MGEIVFLFIICLPVHVLGPTSRKCVPCWGGAIIHSLDLVLANDEFIGGGVK
jgi:hypothetical protein